MSWLRRCTLLWITLLLVLPAAASQPPRIVVLGDSISAAYGMAPEAGWVSLWQPRLASAGLPHQLINASISGNTSGDGLARLPRLLQEHQPQWVIIELGGNDGLRGYPLKTIRHNLQQLISLSRAAGAQVALIGMAIPPSYGKRYSEQFRALFSQLATEQQVQLIPGFLDDIARDPLLMQDDGIHPTAAAQPQLSAQLEQQLQPLLTVPGGK